MKKKIKDLTKKDQDKLCCKYNDLGDCGDCPLNITMRLGKEQVNGYGYCLKHLLDKEIDL